MLKSSQGVMVTFVKKLSKKLTQIENSTLKSYRKIYVEKLSKKLTRIENFILKNN